ncbi:hypothetical protein GO732_07700 [Gordonibacter sp. ResAG-26]|uniref:Leucine-rich repeat protein n=1 Tax=Gordonibacter urolithinfaciens TaxID=1335613 RepID=A0A6N8IF43_9ACTN|nr:hypothetical protein [Gordonibacter urolithinfaciens]MVM54764.1 hypothetical protein [Gordonibacter urolithinfaciens]MVN14392.1 hypothetical protein [Gordonibacter urolithinfaciens]MVN38746.1 hypothetical protein [Gordonibacter urolithinfaciens]MVN56489.1 hypothetical protein [Gordonibacter urolithinfaciens]MVN60807.1 hypothetical protein [Gordonibacter urolithinfaciens]
MTKPALHSIASLKAAPLLGAAFALCLLLVLGLLWPFSYSFAASEAASEASSPFEAAPEAAFESAKPVGSSDATTSPVDDVNNVIVTTPSTEPSPPTAPVESPATPSVPEYENAWPIGLDEAAAVVAEFWDDGTFVVDGAGDTLAFESADEVPWLADGVADDIKRVVFADAVEPSSLAHWFEGCANLEEVANVPADAKDLTRAFFDCPKLVELPDDLAFADDAILEECFGFAELPDEPLTTVYRGTDEKVLVYAWDLDGRILANPDAPVPPAAEEPADPEAPADDPSDKPADDPAEDAAEEPLPESDEPLASMEEAPEPEADSAAPDVPEEEAAQVNITIPSSVSMMLGEDDLNSATIPVMVANRSERAVAITGARLKRSDMDLPGGSWSLSTESGATTFVQDARFTPLGLEVTFDRPVILAAGDMGTQLVWHGTFTDYGMRTLLDAVIASGDSGFTYGSMTWIVSAA